MEKAFKGYSDVKQIDKKRFPSNKHLENVFLDLRLLETSNPRAGLHLPWPVMPNVLFLLVE